MAISSWIGSVSWNSSISTRRYRSCKSGASVAAVASRRRARTSRSWNSSVPATARAARAVEHEAGGDRPDDRLAVPTPASQVVVDEAGQRTLLGAQRIEGVGAELLPLVAAPAPRRAPADRRFDALQPAERGRPMSRPRASRAAASASRSSNASCVSPGGTGVDTRRWARSTTVSTSAAGRGGGSGRRGPPRGPSWPGSPRRSGAAPWCRRRSPRSTAAPARRRAAPGATWPSASSSSSSRRSSHRSSSASWLSSSSSTVNPGRQPGLDGELEQACGGRRRAACRSERGRAPRWLPGRPASHARRARPEGGGAARRPPSR